MSELQAITDSLARRLGRPVELDDADIRLLTHSAQSGAVDDERVSSIMRRRAPEKVVGWLRSLGIAESHAPVRVPANAEFGSLPRVCVPIRCQGLHLGYLLLIDADSSLSDDDLEMACSAAEAAGNVLYREMLLARLELGRERELLRDLLSEQLDVRRYAADALVKEDLFVGGSGVAALVAQPSPTEGAPAAWNDDLRLAVGKAMEHVRWSRPGRRSLQLVRPDHGVLVAAVVEPRHAAEEMLALGKWLHAMMVEQLADVGLKSLVVGVGEVQSSLVDAVRSYEQARHSARVAELTAGFGPVVHWSRLGIYQMLLHFQIEHLGDDALHPGLARLFEHPGCAWLVETLERYLDNAGDVKATARDLALHRATLYYRLRKIEEVAGVSLGRGEDRLGLHLGLKLARLAGRTIQEPGVPRIT